MTNSPYLISNPLISAQPLGLSQIKDFTPAREFTDSDGVSWRLVKSAFDSSVAIPDPSMVTFTDAWCHEFPDSNGKVWCYCAEGVKRPAAETERQMRVLYNWFATSGDPQFGPARVTQQEWYRANVYAASVTDARMSKFNALCGVAASQAAPMGDLIQLPKKEP
jgi:hypothetical protein